jgi:hypothetical protein
LPELVRDANPGIPPAVVSMATIVALKALRLSQPFFSMKTEKQISIANDSNGLRLEADLVGLHVVRVPIGTFGGTVERLVLTQNGDTQGLDTGSQGGGQN